MEVKGMFSGFKNNAEARASGKKIPDIIDIKNDKETVSIGCFKPELIDLNLVNKQVCVEYTSVQKGDKTYHNLVRMSEYGTTRPIEPSENSCSPNPEPKRKTFDDVMDENDKWLEKDKRIARMASINSAIEFCSRCTVHNDLEVEELLKYAQKFYEWTMGEN